MCVEVYGFLANIMRGAKKCQVERLKMPQLQKKTRTKILFAIDLVMGKSIVLRYLISSPAHFEIETKCFFSSVVKNFEIAGGHVTPALLAGSEFCQKTAGAVGRQSWLFTNQMLQDEGEWEPRRNVLWDITWLNMAQQAG